MFGQFFSMFKPSRVGTLESTQKKSMASLALVIQSKKRYSCKTQHIWSECKRPKKKGVSPFQLWAS